MEVYAAYGAIIIAVVGFIIQFNMFVRPVEMERKHREIINEISQKFATGDSQNDLKEEMKDLKYKIDQIYKILMRLEQGR